MSRRPADQEARDRARFELKANVVVEAGAGTGKTTLLTDRILFTLLAGGPDGKGVDLTRIVGLTFTDKAAAEVQLRLAARLSDVLSELEGKLPAGDRREEALRLLAEAKARYGLGPEAVGAAAARAVERMDRAMIGTIHHFASHVLRLHPLEAGVDPSFEVDTGPGMTELFDAEWAAWLDVELGERAPRREAWLSILPLVGLEDLENLARELCLEENGQGRPGSTAAMRARIESLAKSLRRFGEKAAPKGKILEGAAAAAGRLEDLALACAGRGQWPASFELSELKEYSWPKSWEGDPDEPAYWEALEIAGAASGDGERLVRRAVELVLPFAERLRERHRRRGLVSYFGLLRRARDLVRDHADVRGALKARWDALFIDEFQDTDPIQGELLLYLAERRGGAAKTWRDLRLEPGKLFVVGDPKQSIDRFRGADIRAYQDCTDLLLRQGALKCDLTVSFRSHAGVVDPVNAIHDRLMLSRPGLQPSYLAIQPYREAKAGAALELVVSRAAEGEKLGADAGRAREAAWIASWIAANCGERKAHKFRDVALLLRATTNLEPYLDALKAAGLPYAVEADRYFYGTQEVVDLLNLLRVLDDPSDRVSLFGLLRSPLAALDDRELYELKLAGGADYRREPPRALSKTSRERVARFFGALASLRERAGREPLGDFVARVFRETFLVELASAAYYGEQTASNLQKFARLAVKAGDDRGATLKEFIGLVERDIREGTREGESPLADEHLDAVRILSVHKSKGLEWPVVILPNLSAPPRSSELGIARVDWGSGAVGLALTKAKAADAAMAFLKLEEGRREGFEAVRLLYVAMTRARERLILCGSQAFKGEKCFTGLLARAGAWPAPAGGSPESLALGGRAVPISYLDADVPAPGAAKASEEKGLALDGLGGLWKDRRKAAKAAEKPASTSATRLAALEPKPASKPDAESSEDGPAPESAPRLLGVVCHRVLERWDYRADGDFAAAARREAERLVREGARADAALLASESAGILKGFLESDAASGLAQAEILGREVPFLYADGGQVIRGSIDLLYREGKRLWVADYKTERTGAREAEALAKRHAAQSKVYREAVRRALGEACGFKLVLLRTGQVIES
ncbi:MAG: UvrD-helicase domain-containing protein [Elusimicrobia bacterium]|nr:UvrD-helicase domain-containing protein [Elusimicrobiota bacterium]